MITPAMSMGDFKVSVRTTNNRGFTTEELAQQCVEKLIHVADDAPPAIKEQAVAFRNHIAQVIQLYLQQAVQSDRTTVYNALMQAGQPNLAELIRRL